VSHLRQWYCGEASPAGGRTQRGSANEDVSVGGSEWMQREMVAVQDRSTIAESAGLHVHWCEYGFLAEGRMKKRQ
jgi:hypothetical protein